MTFSVHSLSLILASVTGIVTFIAIKNPMMTFMMATLAAVVTEGFLRLQSEE